MGGGSILPRRRGRPPKSAQLTLPANDGAEESAEPLMLAAGSPSELLAAAMRSVPDDGEDHQAGERVLELGLIPESELADMDIVSQTRDNYARSLLGFRAAISQPAHDFREKEAIGKLCLAYMRHIDNSSALQMQLRRNTNDDHLKSEILRMKAEMLEISKRRLQAEAAVNITPEAR